MKSLNPKEISTDVSSNATPAAASAPLAGALPDREAVMRALSRVLEASEFRASQQLSAFLTFSVGRTLEGRGHTLKAYTIATEVLRRRSDFDPTIDPIVRVEATRLRRALERFYGNEGAGESVRIVLPRGGYAVTFACDENASPAQAAPAPAEPAPRRRSIGTAFSARLRLRPLDERSPMLWAPIGAAVFGLSFWISSAADPLRHAPRTASPQAALVAVSAPAFTAHAPIPTVVEAETAALEPLAENMRDALVGVPGLKVRARGPGAAAEAGDGIVLSLRRAAGEAPRIAARLVCGHDGVILWTASFPSEERAEVIARDVAEVVADRDASRNVRECASSARAAARHQ